MSNTRTDYFTTEEAAAYLRLQPSTLAVWRCRHKGPRYRKMGSRVIYLRNDLDDYASNCVVHTIDTAPQLRRDQ